MEGGKMINTRLEDITKHRIKNVTLKNFLLYKDRPKYGVEQLYISLTYTYEDVEGNKKELIIPKINLDILTNKLPDICKYKVDYPLNLGFDTHYNYYIKTVCGFELKCEEIEEMTVTDYNKKTFTINNVSLINIITERKPNKKKMTLSEIEKELGYKIEIVN